MIELKFTVNNCSLPRMNGCPAAIIIVLLFLQTAFCHETNCFPLILYAGTSCLLVMRVRKIIPFPCCVAWLFLLLPCSVFDVETFFAITTRLTFSLCFSITGFSCWTSLWCMLPCRLKFCSSGFLENFTSRNFFSMMGLYQNNMHFGFKSHQKILPERKSISRSK